MKKLSLALVMILIISLFSGTALALHSPGVLSNGGVVSGMIVGGDDLSLGGEYGLTNELAVIGNVGAYNRLGLKYQFQNNAALLGGFMEGSSFIGLNGARSVKSDLLAIGEVNLLIDDDVDFVYKLGARYNLDHQLDLRVGMTGKIDAGMPDLMIGVGYRY
ncbi:hypothetical protein [Fuchsiella alkaliacetigena]|uniref:hypothetical protein n=1 Tax=Fuchsiella alkaliacetigena TaxID=957042 RepID=UPI00200A403C|nr:hypothetical protein [Fuchsiella alkaliacetigena]MCK8824111.1 hypothetical protein [Fuchsiella alkaliacetigena]